MRGSCNGDGRSGRYPVKCILKNGYLGVFGTTGREPSFIWIPGQVCTWYLNLMPVGVGYTRGEMLFSDLLIGFRTFVSHSIWRVYINLDMIADGRCASTSCHARSVVMVLGS